MDQPTAEEALKKLESLVDEWTLEATSGDGEPWPGGGRSTFGWHNSGAHLIERSTVELPEAPDGISIIGCDAANGTYVQLYSDERGVCRIYEMEHRCGRMEALAGWRAVPAAPLRDDQRGRKHDHRALGEGRGRHQLHDRLLPDLSEGRPSYPRLSPGRDAGPSGPRGRTRSRRWG